MTAAPSGFSARFQRFRLPRTEKDVSEGWHAGRLHQRVSLQWSIGDDKKEPDSTYCIQKKMRVKCSRKRLKIRLCIGSQLL